VWHGNGGDVVFIPRGKPDGLLLERFDSCKMSVLENTREPSRCYLGLYRKRLQEASVYTSRAFPLAKGALGP